MRVTTTVVALAVFVVSAIGFAGDGEVDLSPGSWPDGEFEKYSELSLQWGSQRPLAEGSVGMIAATSQPLAVRSGLEALKQGGTAADAAMTHALANIVLFASCCVSHAGIMNVMYFEAETGKTYSMNGEWNTILGETDPMTIPGLGEPSGRTALVGGFMAGVEAMHSKFGKLPFERLFEPAIYFAEEGFEIYPVLAGMIQSKTEVLSRRLDTKAIFTRENGEWYQTGDLFQQPELAHTLRMVARHGAGYMYSGPWAERLVAAVRSEGGTMTMEDLESYEVLWSEPLNATFKGYDVYTPPPPNLGGVNMLEALNLVERADLPDKGHPTESAEAFYTLARIARMADVLGTSLSRHVTPTEMIERYIGTLDLEPTHRATEQAADRLWSAMQTPGWATLDRESIEWRPVEQFGNHSDAVVAVDQWGNVCAVVHTINTSLWGDTGIVVGGMAIADSAKYQQEKIRRTGPGRRLQLETNPLIVVKDGKPVVASSSIGMGVHEQTLQGLVNVLDYGMDPRTALYTPQLLRPLVGGSSPQVGGDVGSPADQVVADGEFDDALLDQVRAMGLGITEVPAAASSGWRGYWVGIVVDPETGALQGAAPGLVAGWAEGY